MKSEAPRRFKSNKGKGYYNVRYQSNSVDVGCVSVTLEELELMIEECKRIGEDKEGI